MSPLIPLEPHQHFRDNLLGICTGFFAVAKGKQYPAVGKDKQYPTLITCRLSPKKCLHFVQKGFIGRREYAFPYVVAVGWIPRKG